MHTVPNMEIPEEQQRIQLQASFRCVCLHYSMEANTPPGVGTGTLLKHRDNLFVLTCDHVIDDFARCTYADISNPGLAKRVKGADTEIIHRDPALDVAVLRIKQSMVHRFAPMYPICLQDIGTEEDYARALPGDNRYCVTGFPASLRSVDEDAKMLTISPFCCATAVKKHTSTKLHFDYRHGQWDSGDKLKPHGVSGALFFEMIPDRPGQLTKSGPAVAMQTAWDPEPMELWASPIYQLREIIEQATR